MNSSVESAIRAKIIEIAKSLGNNATNLRADQDIPASGLLDSAGLMELMFWFETEYDIEIPQEELTVANFGTIQAMEGYLDKVRGKE